MTAREEYTTANSRLEAALELSETAKESEIGFGLLEAQLGVQDAENALEMAGEKFYERMVW